MLVSFLVLTCVAVAMGVSTTHHPHASQVPHETHSFFYYAKTHQMVMKTPHMCYIMNLDHREQTLVHSPAGLHQIEGQLLSLIDQAQTTVMPANVDTHIAQHCTDHQKNQLIMMMVN